MARFKRRARRSYGFARAATRSVRYVRSARRSARRSTGSPGIMNVVLPAFAYGAVRPTLKTYAAPLTQAVPLGNNSDEVVFGLLGYLMAKKGRGFVKNAGTAILTVEAASLGNNLIAPMVSGATGSTTITSQTTTYGGFV
jgi:hypothetical protein